MFSFQVGLQFAILDGQISRANTQLFAYFILLSCLKLKYLFTSSEGSDGQVLLSIKLGKQVLSIVFSHGGCKTSGVHP